MIKYYFFLLLLLIYSCEPSKPKSSNEQVDQGTIERLTNFNSSYIPARNIDIWLPKDYDSTKKHQVLYMHDGQMLFDSTTTWNKQEWGVDEVLQALIDEKKVAPTIVVGIWNGDQRRHIEYFPQKPFERLPQEVQDSLKETGKAYHFNQTLQSDNYLKFIVHELKPYVDAHFATYQDQAHTFIAGSSMGGLISMYALCEYPKIFGGAACLSTHWIGTFETKNNPIPEAFVNYLDKHLPSPTQHQIYFDYGTETLDALYEPTQVKVDSIMQKNGFSDKNWITKKFTGADHSERSWNKRLHIPLQFILAKS